VVRVARPGAGPSRVRVVPDGGADRRGGEPAARVDGLRRAERRHAREPDRPRTRSSNTASACGRHSIAPPHSASAQTRSPSLTAACSATMQPTEWPTSATRSISSPSSSRSRSSAHPSTEYGPSGLSLSPAPRWSYATPRYPRGPQAASWLHHPNTEPPSPWTNTTAGPSVPVSS
jgi:hypothetical protein